MSISRHALSCHDDELVFFLLLLLHTHAVSYLEEDTTSDGQHARASIRLRSMFDVLITAVNCTVSFILDVVLVVVVVVVLSSSFCEQSMSNSKHVCVSISLCGNKMLN